MEWRDDGQGCVGQGCKTNQAQPGLSCVVWRRDEKKKVGTETGWGKEGFRAILCIGPQCGVTCISWLVGLRGVGEGGPFWLLWKGHYF